MSEWFEHWFGEDYLRLYRHRDEQEAERAVALLASRRVGLAGQLVLDLACGPGRHAQALERRGARVVGYDLSAPLLLAARRSHVDRLVRGDMRELGLRSDRFDAVVNLFTSFGYFERDGEHQRVLREVARVLKRGGRFVLDFLNAPAVRATLVPRDERRTSREMVVQERQLSDDGRYVIKRIHLGGDSRTYEERVRLFERAELEALLRGASLEPREVLGDYDGNPHGPDSARCLLIAERA